MEGQSDGHSEVGGCGAGVGVGGSVGMEMEVGVHWWQLVACSSHNCVVYGEGMGGVQGWGRLGEGVDSGEKQLVAQWKGSLMAAQKWAAVGRGGPGRE